MVTGVSQVMVQGAQKYTVRVQIDPDKLHSQQIGLNEITNALTNWNVDLPTGQLYGPHSTYNINAASGQLRQRRRVPLDHRRVSETGRAVRLDQVAHVIDSVENVYNEAWFYTKDAQQRPQKVERSPSKSCVSQARTRSTPRTRSRAPASLRRASCPRPGISRPARTARRPFAAAFSDIQVTMLLTLVLVVAVIYLFLHNGSATLIPALALPFSILGTFTVMQLLGFSLNNLSMMALILSIGFVVDDAIVMLENIVRHMEHGESALDAALRGSREIAFTIVSMTVSLAAVFIPILFMTGVLGRLFREFAVTITAAILISGIVSVTLTPMLCSRFLRVNRCMRKPGSTSSSKAVSPGCRAATIAASIVLRYRPVMLVVFVLRAGRNRPHVPT